MLQTIDKKKLEYQQALGKMYMFICKPLTANVSIIVLSPLQNTCYTSLAHASMSGRQGPAPDVYDLVSLKRWGDP